ncbi:ABC transporter ATP-binding protein [Xylocopilactobacillus apicola]|uniref:ABC transporter ATP-binding protein n=1 Tax=Xylocopilactobacillus apicola TaxID=2932184 RepID=A0AAU9CW58_9LACO|nr:ATP-binding cassette domain-containing protein [Xylocopilactobacillus apicola]BDR58222.1 ABC transporter ATP-binding protein [Xylocopilactobacillus apicola]
MLEIQNLTYQIDQEILFKDLSFTVEDGHSLLMTGPSGGGKSTILKIIARLVGIQKGEVSLNQQDIYDLPIETYRQRVSYAAQSAQLFGQTIRDNLDLPFLIRNLPIDQAKEKAGLEQMELSDKYLDKPINDLSGGEKQRVGVLRNLIFPPDVLLLDEISTGLDAKTKSKIWEFIDKLQAEHQFCLITVSHDQGEIDRAENKIVIGGGSDD